MNASPNGSADHDQQLDRRLRDLYDHIGGTFAADLHDPAQLATFRQALDRHTEIARERARREACFRGILTANGFTGHHPPAGAGIRRAPAHRKRRHATGITTVSLALVGVLVGVLLVVRLVNASSQSISGFGTSGLEKPDLKFSVMTTTDLGPFWLAVTNGYFRDAGFTFDPRKDVTTARSGAASVATLAAGHVDIAYATYPPFFVAQTRGEADIKLVADASSAGPNSCKVVVMPGGKIRDIEDLAGARIAVTARNTMADLMVMSTLRAHGVDHSRVEWVEMPFPSMAAALKSGEIDAAFMTEPFQSQAEQTVGAMSLVDVGTGPTENIPTAGFGASAEFVRENPKTVAAFQKVMERATTEAKADRTRVEPLLQEFAGVDAETARRAELLTFQSSLDAGRIQRVTDLMLEFGMIDEKIDASRIIAKAPNSR